MHVKRLISFRQGHEALRAGADFRFLTDGDGCPLVYERKNGEERLLIAVNPSPDKAFFRLSNPAGNAEILMSYKGAAARNAQAIEMPAGSYIVLSI